MKKHILSHCAIFLLLSGSIHFLNAQAVLPTYFSDFSGALPAGWTETITGSLPTHDNCNGPSARFNAANQRITINYATAATNVSYSMSDQGAGNRTLLVEESVNGVAWTTVQTWTQATAPVLQTIYTHPLNAASRWVRFNMTVRTNGRMEVDIINVYNTIPHPTGGACDLNPYDCLNATPLCSDATFAGNSNDFGYQELNAGNAGCLGVETESFWYYWQPATNGNMEFTITPGAGFVDYDFAIWQTTDCNNLGTPVRCSFSAVTTPTGLSNGAGDNSEDPLGDGWVEDLPMLVGQTYILLVDNYTGNTTPFTIDFNLTNGLTLDCTPTPLPVTLVDFNGWYSTQMMKNKLNWATYSEINNHYFELEFSENLEDWKVLGTIPGANNSNELKAYEYYHNSPFETTYYRLSQVDFDGVKETFEPISISRMAEEEVLDFQVYPNPSVGNLKITGKFNGELEMIVTDILGHIVEQGSVQLSAGIGDIDLSGLNAGIYQVELRSSTQSQFHKIIIN
jgi:hypothetical protein